MLINDTWCISMCIKSSFSKIPNTYFSIVYVEQYHKAGPSISKDATFSTNIDDEDCALDVDDLLNLNVDMGCESVEGQRVHQLAMICRNLSFEESNMLCMSTNAVLYR